MAWAADMGITLDHGAEVPLGVQLGWSVRAAIAAGRLQSGDRLPALRELAEELGVNHNTLRAVVARLEADGLLESRHGSGTYVAPDAAAHERHAPLVEQAARWASDAGVDPRELAAALYVRGAAETPAPDSAAEERRTLRDEIAVLERVLARLDVRRDAEDHKSKGGVHVDLEEVVPRAGRPGARMLSTDDLRTERDALVRRVGEAQRALDGEPEPAPHPVAEKAPARKPRPKPVPRAQPT